MTATEADARLAERAAIERLIQRELETLSAIQHGMNTMMAYDAKAGAAVLRRLLAKVEAGEQHDG